MFYYSVIHDKSGRATWWCGLSTEAHISCQYICSSLKSSFFLFSPSKEFALKQPPNKILHIPDFEFSIKNKIVATQYVFNCFTIPIVCGVNVSQFFVKSDRPRLVLGVQNSKNNEVNLSPG